MNPQKKTRILIAMDSFKGSATSLEIAGFVRAGILRVQPDASIEVLPVADGGEGTVEALVNGLGGIFKTVPASGPLGQKLTARYGILPGNQAIIEMASASGLTLIPEVNRDPFHTSTFGTGEILLSAIEHGCTRILIGLGGSATNDGGVGMAQALGVSFLSKTGQEVGPGSAGLAELKSIRLDGLDPRVRQVEITALTDVNNPLCGANGASFTFGRQKGARPEDLDLLEKRLKHLANLVKLASGKDFSNFAGAGAAGGLGFGLLSFCGAEIQPGIETILNMLHFVEHIRRSDLVITGEGCLDEQSLYGKAPVGIAAQAKKCGVPVIAIVGSSQLRSDQSTNAGFDFVLELKQESMSLKEAIENTPKLAQLAGETAMMAFLSGQGG